MGHQITIKNGWVIDPRHQVDEVRDIVLPVADEKSREFDAMGMLVVPGLVDMHVHFREPGFTHKETIETGSQAAAKGGYTTVCCMPNTHPVIDHATTIKWIAEQAKKIGLVNLLIAGALSKSQLGQEAANYEEMKNAGVSMLTDDGKTLKDRMLMCFALKEAKRLDLLVSDHAEPEAEIVARDITLVKETGTRLHLQHISTQESLALIKVAKKQGLPITAETAPHYISLTQEALKTHGSNAKMNPPLQTEADRVAIIEAIKDGTLDVIATDHAPHSVSEKSMRFKQTPFGVVGLETAFAVSYTHLVKAGHITLTELINLMSINPAKILSIPNNDWAVFEIKKPYMIDSKTFASKGRNTPFHGMEVYGRPVLTICNGKVIYHDSYFI